MARRPERLGPKAPIHHAPGNLHLTVQAMLEVAAEHAQDMGLYQFAGTLVEVAASQEDSNQDGVRRGKGAYTMRPLSPASLSRMFSRHMLISKDDGRMADRQKVVDIPKALAEAFLSLPSFDPVPEIIGICQAAMLDPAGKEYSTPGYHPGLKVLLVTDKPLAKMPGVAGRARGRKGLEKIRHLLRGFVFKTEADLSAAIAGLLTALNRKAMPAAPMFQVTAPAAGTGKSKFVDVVAVIVTGRPAAVLAIGRDENELNKRLAGVLAQGDPIISFDNVVREFGREDILLQSLTQSHVLIRLLGASSILRVPTLITFFATGNNLRPVSDLKRRSCLVRMDANVERPEFRSFDFDVLEEAARERDHLIRAALDISRSYLEAGAPPVTLKNDKGEDVPLKPAGSFETWDKMVRRALVWHGMPDPLETAETLRELDPELEAAGMLVDAWYRIHQDCPVKAGDVIEQALVKVRGDGDDWVLQNQDLSDALHVVCQDNVNARRLGNWLRKNRDFIVNGKRLVQAGRDSHANTLTWKVERVAA